MLHIEVKGGYEFYDEESNEFIKVRSQKLVMEHSLLSISKWEARWKKPFLSRDKKTPDEYLDYIRCMTITPNVDPLIYKCLTKENLIRIRNYIEDSHTATTINDMRRPHRSRIKTITSELIYYWMIAAGIPIECEKWHLGRLMILIEICNIENNPQGKKMSRSAIYRQNQELNAIRRAKYHTKG